MGNSKLIMVVFFLAFTSIYLTALGYFSALSGFDVVMRTLIVMPLSAFTSGALYYFVYVRN